MIRHTSEPTPARFIPLFWSGVENFRVEELSSDTVYRNRRRGKNRLIKLPSSLD